MKSTQSLAWALSYSSSPEIVDIVTCVICSNTPKYEKTVKQNHHTAFILSAPGPEMCAICCTVTMTTSTVRYFTFMDGRVTAAYMRYEGRFYWALSQ